MKDFVTSLGCKELKLFLMIGKNVKNIIFKLDIDLSRSYNIDFFFRK